MRSLVESMQERLTKYEDMKTLKELMDLQNEDILKVTKAYKVRDDKRYFKLLIDALRIVKRKTS